MKFMVLFLGTFTLSIVIQTQWKLINTYTQVMKNSEKIEMIYELVKEE